MTIKVVHMFKDYYPPTTGGIEQHMQLLCKGSAAQMDVSVLVPSRTWRSVEERLDNVSIVRSAEYGRLASVPLSPGFPRHLRRLRPDLVHLHFPNPMGDIAYLLSARTVPSVLTYHADIIKQRALLPIYQPLRSLLFAKLDRIIVATNEFLESSPVLRRYRHKCTVIPYGIDLAPFKLQGEDEAHAVATKRAEYGDRTILFTGVLRHYKGLDVLLEAMPRVKGNLLIAGRGAEKARLEAKAAQLGLGRRVRFLGEVSATELRLLLHASDVFVLPSTNSCETFGIAQLEAMACGLPVVSSDLPTGVRFVNRHGHTGLLVPPSDTAALAQALNQLLTLPNLRQRLGQQAQRRVHQEFTAERMIANTQEVYREVLDDHRTAPQDGFAYPTDQDQAAA